MSLKTTRLLSCICLASWLSGCQVTTTGKNGYNGNWAPLFDGTSLAGWKQSAFLTPRDNLRQGQEACHSRRRGPQRDNLGPGLPEDGLRGPAGGHAGGWL